MDNRMSLLTSPFVPEGMVDLMKKLSKGVIKERPANIYEYAAEFFEQMLIERDGSLDKGYGKFRSYSEYCKFMDKMDQRRLNQTTKKVDEIANTEDTVDAPQEEVLQLTNIEVQGVAIQGVERKSKDSVKNVSINPKYKSQSEKTAKPVVSNVKNAKTKPRKLSSKKPSENLIVIKEETSADVDDSSNGDFKLHKAAMTIQKAFRMYMSKKSSQDEPSSQTFGNVSQLSEDAAAVIIQKAFKSLIQKLKPEVQNREKAADESNNNIVIPGAGQEIETNVNKIINNTDEHSKQILVDDGRTEVKHDLEHKDTLDENTLEGTATNSEIETKETTNLEKITALEATAAQRVETEQIRIEDNKTSSDEGNQIAIASDNNDESVHNEDLALHQQNDPLIPSTTIPLDLKTEIDEIQKVTDQSATPLDEIQLKEEAEGSGPVEIEAQPPEIEVATIRSESLKSGETKDKNVSDDPVVDNQTELITNVTDVALENKSDLSDVGKIASDSGQDDLTVPLNSSGTDSDMDHLISVGNKESEGQTISVEPSENTSNISAQEEKLNDINDNVEKNSSSTDNNLMQEEVSKSPVKQQLFVVDKDGIYVNMDLLQEKFGTTEIGAIDDGTGNDSEKTFKLNILEREEILVNQENIQQIKDEEVAMNTDIIDKSLSIGKIVEEMGSTGKIVEEVESTGKIVEEVETAAKMVEEVESTGKIVEKVAEELENSGKIFYDVENTGKIVEEMGSTGKIVEEVESTGKLVEEVETATKMVEEVESTGKIVEKVAKELENSGKILYDVENTGKIVEETAAKMVEGVESTGKIVEKVAEELDSSGEIFDDVENTGKIVEEVENNTGKIVEEVESTAASNCDIKDEDGNEEYELAETVVLMDIPSKPYLESENGLSTVASEIDTAVVNKLNDETDTHAESLADEKSFQRFSDPVKVKDIDKKVVETTPDEEEITKNEAAVERIEIIGQQSTKIEDPETISNLDGDAIKEHGSQEKAKIENMAGQVIGNESTEEIVKTDIVSEEDDIRSEQVDGQVNLNEVPEFDSEKIVEVDTVKEEQTKDKKIESQSNEDELPEETENEKLDGELNPNELSSSHSEKVEAVIEGEESISDGVQRKLNINEVMVPESIAKIEAVFEVKEAENQNIVSQSNKTELIASSSEKIVKLDDEETNNENLDSKLNKSELKSSETENIVKVEAAEEIETETVEDQMDGNELQAADFEKIVKVEDVGDDKNDNPESHLKKRELTSSNSENIAKVEAIEGKETEKVEDQLHIDQLQLQATDAGKIMEVGAVLVGYETKNENVENQLSTIQSEPASCSSEDGSIKGREISVANCKNEDGQLSQDNCVSLEPVVKSENQLPKKDNEDNVELESKMCGRDDEVVQEKCENVLQENEATSLTTEKIDLPKTEDGSVKAEIAAEISDQIVKNEELVKAATIIQKVFRGYIARNSTTNQNTKKNQPELSAALIIQKYARGYLVRKNMQKIDKLVTTQVASNDIRDDESDTNQTEENSNTAVVPQLPAYSNRFLIPKDSFLERESFADDEDYARTCKELAATSIQKTYRGYRVRRSLKASSENDTETADVHQDDENGIELLGDVLPVDTYDMDSFEDEITDEKNVESESPEKSSKPTEDRDAVLGPLIHDNIHVEGQMQQKYNQIKFQGSPINPIEEMSDSSEQPETPREKPVQTNAVKSKTIESDSLDSKDCEGSKSFSYEQLSSDLSDTEENKRESMKESEVDETSRDERDDLSEVENFDLSSCGEDSLEAMYYSLRKNEIMVDRMQKQVAEQREPKNIDVTGVAAENLKVEFPERVTENLDVAMQQVFKSMESSSDYDVGKKDEDDNSSTLDLALDDSSSINDEKEIETSRHIKQTEEENLEDNEQSQSESTDSTHHANDVTQSHESPERIINVETSTMDQGQQSDSSVNSSTRFIMKSQSVSEDMMNPIMFAMKRKQALLDQLHVRPYPLQENLSEDHDAFPEHLLSDIDIGNIQRKIFASSVSETDSDYIEPNTTGRRLVRDDFNISTALDHLSTDSDSTIVSAATKIQAGARGFLTRRRLRRSSAGGTSISFEKRYSFGNAAIDKSLEDLIKMQEQINLDGAALKIQQQYRRYQARKNNLKKVSPIREQTTLELSGGSSIEGNEGVDDIVGIREITLAQKKVDDCQDNAEENIDAHPISLNIDTVDTVEAIKRTPVNQRRLTLQRGDAVQRNSRPDSQDLNTKDGDLSSPDNQCNEKCKDSETGECIDKINSKKEKKVTAYKNIQSLINRGIGPRQRSMPVQIDSELMRIIPKHLRKRVKSADMAKKRSG
ncbi:titin homolog isoform X2 [Bradysia coprophila]|uniref:titin homolog isoform X2 n=1 Tax=Bradysia coprophila TaxID=38358 RepID=UPI00187DC2CE|nr:titin homolog isoform X2 [Bradysia coprophila]